MKGQRVGYVRVSSVDQNSERQLEGIQLDQVFRDAASGKDTQRPQLEALLAFVREGDVVLVHSLDRLARNLDDLRRLVQQLTSKKVLSFMGAFAEFEGATAGGPSTATKCYLGVFTMATSSC